MEPKNPMRLGGDWTPRDTHNMTGFRLGDQFDWRFLSGKQPFIDFGKGKKYLRIYICKHHLQIHWWEAN